MDQNQKTPVAVATPVAAVKVAPDPTTAVGRKAIYEANLKKSKSEAKVRVLQFLKDNGPSLGTVANDIKMLIGARGPSGTRAPGLVKSINSDLRAAFLDKKSISEMDVFKTYHIGRPEMTNKIRVLVLCPNKADRVWVKLDDVGEKYDVVGVGAKAPDGWTGYDPDAVKTL
jgi:hypothetical protein